MTLIDDIYFTDLEMQISYTITDYIRNDNYILYNSLSKILVKKYGYTCDILFLYRGDIYKVHSYMNNKQKLLDDITLFNKHNIFNLSYDVTKNLHKSFMYINRIKN